jgi:mannose-1-phosphate guanylyltransferase
MKLVVIAGGEGSRLWPVSRSSFPKQFISLVSGSSMLQDTIMRVDENFRQEPYIVCNDSTRFLVAEELQKINSLNSNIILEPMGRNTAPAIALAAAHAMKDDDPVLLVLSADHVILDESKFRESIKIAQKQALEGKLVTFGVVPSHPETGYGYIKKAKTCDSGRAFNVANFVEKPDLETAKKYISSGHYLWNSGMFMFKASRYLEELKKFEPEIYRICIEAVMQSTEDLDFIRISEEIFKDCPNISIDNAVMEKTDVAVVVPLNAGWSDVGSWSSLYDVSVKDKDSNVIGGDSICIDTKNTLIRGEERLITTIGVEGLVIVDTKDALLVAKKDQSQKVKQITNELKERSRLEYFSHREVYRPWGKYDSIDQGERYQVKLITVKPGQKLSLQMHHHRAEHWIVVSGTAKVTLGQDEIMLSENESTYIPLGVIHALENPGKIPLELIEVQSGSYLGEDDIVRFEDKYGRI